MIPVILPLPRGASSGPPTPGVAGAGRDWPLPSPELARSGCWGRPPCPFAGRMPSVGVPVVGVPGVGNAVLLAGLDEDIVESEPALAGDEVTARRRRVSVGCVRAAVVSTPGRPETGAPAEGSPSTEGLAGTGADGVTVPLAGVDGVTVPLAGVVDAGCCPPPGRVGVCAWTFCR